MKKLLALYLMTGSLALSDTNKYDIPKQECKSTVNVATSFRIKLNYANKHSYVEGIEYFLDTNCNGKFDQRNMTLMKKIYPVIYKLDRDEDGIEEELYVDRMQDGINNNEAKCISLDDCFTKAFVIRNETLAKK